MTSPAPKTRRTHTKSRGGCFECKKRKLKCGEEKPICHGCTKRGTSCEYPRLETARSSPHPGSPGSSLSSNRMTVANLLEPNHSYNRSSSSQPPQNYGAATDSSIADPVKVRGQFDMQDMALWHHFIKYTADTISSPWKEELPSVALTCDYLMHGILAMGALHLAYLKADVPDTQRMYNYLATQHQDLALGPFQQAMATISSENAGPLFAFSTLLMAYNFASNRSPEYMFPFTTGRSFSGLSNWIMSLRGCTTIFRVARDHLAAGPFGFLIVKGYEFHQTISSDGSLPPLADDKSLSKILDVVLHFPTIKSTTTVEEMESYAEAIQILRNLFAAAAQGLDSLLRRSAASVWVSMVSETYIRLLSEQRPPALIIFAHYCLLLKGCDDCWYMEHRADALFDAIEKCLAPEWLGYIQHPRRVIKGMTPLPY